MCDESIDVAIVGAGVSGVYVAWRLMERFPEQHVVVFEGSRRVGGRLLSVRPPEIPHMVAELGGMRILPAVQPLIKRLIDVLNERLPEGDKIELYDFPVDQPQNLAYLRGKYLRLSDFQQKPEKVPYELSFLERGLSAGQILLNAIERIVPGITRANLTEPERRRLTQNAEFCDKPLYEQGFWNVLMRVISAEAYLLGVDAGGYNSTLANWNAADAIPWFLSDFGVDSQYKGFRDGFQQVPLTLAKLFKARDGDLRLGTKVTGFRQLDNGYELSVGAKTVSAQKLILAMPRRSLELLTPHSPPLQEIADLIGSVTPRPLFKLYTTYNDPWWRNAGFYHGSKLVAVEAGRSVSDLPLRQVYYWPKNNGEPVQEGPAMLLASYDDGTNIGFWDGLRERRGRTPKEGREVPKPAHAFVGPADTARPADKPGPAVQPDNAPELDALPSWAQYPVPTQMVNEVARQLAVMHGLAYTPHVRSAAYRDWGDDPYGGGWNSWNIGVPSADVKNRIVQPFDPQPLYICGEAYSDAQGWVEGAFQTADMVLKRFGIDPL